MAATPYRSTCTVDGFDFHCVSISVAFSTQKDRTGKPLMGSLNASIRCLVDFHDHENMSNNALRTLFDLTKVVTRHKMKDMKVVFWTDDSKQDALCSYHFKGWIKDFHTFIPQPQNGNGGAEMNHCLLLTLQPLMDEQNFADIRMSNG